MQSRCHKKAMRPTVDGLLWTLRQTSASHSDDFAHIRYGCETDPPLKRPELGKTVPLTGNPDPQGPVGPEDLRVDVT